MSQFDLTKIGLSNGVWAGLLTRVSPDDAPPAIEVMHRDQPVPDVTVAPGSEADIWHLNVPVPTYAIAEGVHSFTITDARDGTQLGHFTLMAGEAMTDDIRAEIDLLRAELDMLKRAFRRHCVETT